MEKQNGVTYRTVDGVLDKKDVSADEAHGFQINGDFGILTNISTNGYVSTMVVFYFLSTLWTLNGSATKALINPNLKNISISCG